MNIFNSTCKKHFDKIGQPYLALDLDGQHHDLFKTIMEELKLVNQWNKKMVRDKNQYHITLINAMEYSNLSKNNPNELIEIENKLLNSQFEFESFGVGKISEKSDNTYFYVVSNELLNNFLKTNHIKEKNFHITLGFDTKDLHHAPKNKNTIFFDNKEINKLINKKNKHKPK